MGLHRWELGTGNKLSGVIGTPLCDVGTEIGLVVVLDSEICVNMAGGASGGFMPTRGGTRVLPGDGDGLGRKFEMVKTFGLRRWAMP